MGKLLKYEFIKNRVPLFIFAALLVISELVFGFGMIAKNDNAVGISILLFGIMSPVCTLGGLIIGAGTYTKELSNKVGFMVYMTPNSSYKIVGSKFVFTAIVEVFFSGVLALAAYGDASILFKEFGLDEDMLDVVFDYAEAIGISIPELMVKIFATFLTVILSLVMIVAIYYIAYTLTATFMQASKARNWMAALIFIAGAYLVIEIYMLLPDVTYSVVTDTIDIASLVPAVLYSLLIIVISYFSCSYMLDKKVSL